VLQNKEDFYLKVDRKNRKFFFKFRKKTGIFEKEFLFKKELKAIIIPTVPFFLSNIIIRKK